MSRDRLVEMLSYNEETGVFLWRVSRGNKRCAGKVAGGTDSKGYVQIKIEGRLYLAHRLAWLYQHGSFPESDLDHIDRNPKNNSIKNIRLCTHSQNHQNTGIRADNTSGVTGVSWVKKSGKWLAYINTNGRRERIGMFSEKQDAIKARLDAKQKLHVFHPYQELGAIA